MAAAGPSAPVAGLPRGPRALTLPPALPGTEPLLWVPGLQHWAVAGRPLLLVCPVHLPHLLCLHLPVTVQDQKGGWCEVGRVEPVVGSPGGLHPPTPNLSAYPQQSQTLRDMVKLSMRVCVCRPGGGENRGREGGWGRRLGRLGQTEVPACLQRSGLTPVSWCPETAWCCPRRVGRCPVTLPWWPVNAWSTRAL